MKIIEHPLTSWSAQIRCTCDALLEITGCDIKKMKIETLEKHVIICPVCLCHTLIDTRGIPPITLRLAPWHPQEDDDCPKWGTFSRQQEDSYD